MFCAFAFIKEYEQSVPHAVTQHKKAKVIKTSLLLPTEKSEEENVAHSRTRYACFATPLHLRRFTCPPPPTRHIAPTLFPNGNGSRAGTRGSGEN